MSWFKQTETGKRKYGLAVFIGIVAGIVSAFVKWGAENPLPPRSPFDKFDMACAPESLIRAADSIDCSRNFLNPPYLFLRDYLGVSDPYGEVYTFAGHVFNYVGVTHILFSIFFAVAYCIISEKFPKITLWQGLFAGLLVQIGFHIVLLPIMGLTPPVYTLPLYEHISEFVGHFIWFWSIEIMRRDLRSRITKEPDPTAIL